MSDNNNHQTKTGHENGSARGENGSARGENGDSGGDKGNGYLYREHTSDSLFLNKEFTNDSNHDIIQEFQQNIVDEAGMTGNKGAEPDLLTVPAHISYSQDALSILSCLEEEEEARKREEFEEEETLKEPFRAFCVDSYQRLVKKEHERRLKAERAEEDEGRLVDGEIVFDDVSEQDIEKNPKLAEGQSLPESMGRFPRELLSIPLEEIDKNIKDKTFVVIAKKFSKFTIFRFSAEKSLWLFSPWHNFRMFCLSVISNAYFDLLILSTILINCVFMIADPDPLRSADLYSVFNIFEYLFQAVYTLEMLLKIFARGFILHKHAYLRDGWNWLDFFVVIIAYVTIVLDALPGAGLGFNLTGLRAFRVLRALKSISVVPGLRTIVNALLKSLKMLAEVMLLTFFCIAVFALLALQLYMGVLRQKCVKDLPDTFPKCNNSLSGVILTELTNGTVVNSTTDCFQTITDFEQHWIYNPDNYYSDDEGFILCGNGSQTLGCPTEYTCRMVGDNPNWGYTNFDNFGMAMLNTFQLVTLDFWEDSYNKIIDVSGPWNILYFMMVVLLGSFYLVNLMLAVVAMAYEQEADSEAKLAAEEEEEEKAKAKRKENTAMLFDPKKLKMQLLQKQKEEEERKRMEEMGMIGPNGDLLHPEGGGVVDPNSPVKSPRPVTATGEFVKTGQTPNGTKADPNMTVSDMEQERGHTPSPTKTQGSEVTASNVQVQQELSRSYDPELGGEEDEEDENAFHDDLPPITDKQRRYLIQKYANLWFNKIKPDAEQLIDRNCLCCAKSGLPTYHNWLKFQGAFFKVVNDGLFDLFITLCILANTIVMATEHFDRCSICRYCPEYDSVGTPKGIDVANCTICDSTCDDTYINRFTLGVGMLDSHIQFMEISNVVFTVIFTVEAILKLTALSKLYFKVGWNNFDLFIVCSSLPDLIFFFYKEASEIPGISDVSRIVKVFRLLRIIKLAQSWNAMKTLLGIIFNTVGALANLSAILLIIVIIFSVLGNQLLGGEYMKYKNITGFPELADAGGELPRWHFGDFFGSFLMVFRVLCGEWVEPLWDCNRVISVAACTLFFLLTLVLGNFMVLNLFLALLLNAFSSDNLEESTEDSRMVARIKQIVSMMNCKSPRAVTPTEEKMYASQTSLSSRRSGRRTRLEMILDKDDKPPRPAVAINGSTQSLRNLIEATEPREKLNGSVVPMSNGGDSVELKPMSNGLSRSSRSGSLISVLSNGTNHSNGVLKNRSTEMNDENLRQIEQAFTTNRQEYAQFEAAMDASAPKPMRNENGIEKRGTKSVIIDSAKEEVAPDKHNPIPNDDEDDQDEESKVVGADGRVFLPDCCVQAIHRKPHLNDCCTPRWTATREVCAKVVSHWLFESFILFLIAFSSITLCFEDYKLHEQPLTIEVLNYLNIMFAVFFFIEMILKWLALGYVKYFTSFWTILDFIIVMVSLLDIAGTFYEPLSEISAIRTLRILRALRPLRAVSRWQNMRIVVNALIFAMPAIANVAVVIVVFWLVFAIMGVQLFRGLFYSCAFDGEKVETIGEYKYDDWEPRANEYAWCIGTDNSTSVVTGVISQGIHLADIDWTNLTFDYFYNRDDKLIFPSNLQLCTNSFLENKTWPWLCETLGGEWDRNLISFDHLGSAYLALFQVATFEGWMEVMYDAVDSPPNLYEQAYREARRELYIYFMIFIVFGAFFTLNLIIGVIIENFQVLKKKYDGSYLAAFLTDNQRNYYNTLKKLGKKKPQKTIRRPKSKFLAFFFDISVNTKFEIMITLIIFVNMCIMMVDALPPNSAFSGALQNGTYVRNGQEFLDYREKLTKALEYINIIFTMTFVVEAIIKILGLRLHYFRRAWNVFDFVIVILSLFGLVLETALEGDMFISPTLLRVVRVFRIGRVLRLVKSAKGIRKLIFALLMSIPALFNIFLLLFIFMFIFAVMGMSLFANVRELDSLNETVNFQTFFRSMLLLFRLATSAGWNDIFYPIEEQRFCNGTHYLNTLGVPTTGMFGDCGNATLATIFFLVYLFLSFMVIVNMYIAVILENFAQAHEQEEIGITEDDFDMFYVVWEQFDPLATQYIKLEQLSPFLHELEDPLGVPKPNGMAIVAFNLPIVEGDRIHCLDVLMALVRRVLHTSDEETPNMSKEHQDANDKLKGQIAEKYRSAFPQRQKVKVLSTTMQRKKEDVAAKTLQRAWRKHRMKQNIMRIKELALISSQRGSLSHRLSQSFSRVGSASSRKSRPGSGKSVDSRHLALPPEMRGGRQSGTPSPRNQTTKQR